MASTSFGVLLYGHAKNAYWYGSQLSIEETRRLAPYQNATGLQVTSAVLAGIVWMIENPDRGIVEADEMDFRRCLQVQRPYLGPVTATIPTGRRSPVAASCFRKTWIKAIRGSSRTCWCNKDARNALRAE
jgi:homospermidine synthase